MKEKIREILATKTLKQTAVTTFGTIINGALGLFFYILIARYLGPTNFGIFSVATTTIALISSIANIGVDTGIVKFVGKYILSEKDKAQKFLKLGLNIKLIASVVVIVIGWLVMPFVALRILGKPELAYPLRLALLGVGSALLFSFITSSIQAVQKFWVWGGLNIFSNLFRLVAAVALFSLGILTVNTTLAVYIIFPLLGFFLGLLFLPKFWKIEKEKTVLKEFFDYNKWVAIFTFIAAISSRLDTLLSARFLTLGEVGVYSVAVSLTGVVPQIVFAIGTVVAPKLASFTSVEVAAKYLKKLQWFVLALGVIGVIFGVGLGKIVIPILYGPEYLRSFSPFVILLMAQAIFLISIPVHTAVIYYFSYPKLFVYICSVNFLIVLIGGWFMIPAYGYLGAASIYLIGNVANFIIPLIWVIRKFKKGS